MRRLPPAGRAGVAAWLAVAAVSLAVFGWLADVHADGGFVTDADGDVSRWVAAHMPGWAEWLARPFTWIGGVALLPAVCVVAVALLLLARRPGDAVLLVVVTVGVNVLVAITKTAYDRVRPGTGSAIPLPGSSSFPSGHAATGAAVFGLLGLLVATTLDSRRARIVATAAGFLVGAAIGASRVVLNVHYPSDVVAGYAYGLALLAACLLVAAAVRGRRRRRSERTPPSG